VLINLLGNAVKFTEVGGVTLRLRWSAAGESSGTASFEISDTGSGISESELRDLFQAFVQTESGRKAREGTGLGLVISQNIVRMMGGEIRVLSRVGHGTTFTFDVTLAVGSEEALQHNARTVTGLARGEPRRRILVADDSPDNRVMLTKLLKKVGFEVWDVVNGREVVEVWREWRPHLVLMDVRLPVMDGMTVASIIRSEEVGAASGEPAAESEIPHSTKIVALTASVFEHERREFLSLGFDDLITKPFRQDAILECIADHLGVRYAFDELESVPGKTAEADTTALTAERLAAIDDAVVGRLDEALQIGDIVAANSEVDEIRKTDSALADALSRSLSKFEFDAVLRAVESARSHR
jgi:CheY-like chemotaxis protein